MVKHKDVINYIPVFQKLSVVYSKKDGKGGYYKKPAIALAIVRDEADKELTFLIPVISLNSSKELDIAHESDIIGYDDGSEEIDWKQIAMQHDAKAKH